MIRKALALATILIAAALVARARVEVGAEAVRRWPRT